MKKPALPAFLLIACFLSLTLAQGQSLQPRLLFQYEAIAIPSGVNYGTRQIALLENGAVLIEDFPTAHYRAPSGEWVTPPRALE